MTHSKVNVIDKKNNEYVLQNPNDFDFFYDIIKTLFLSNGSIPVINMEGHRELLNVRDIRVLCKLKRSNQKIVLFNRLDNEWKNTKQYKI